jgi:hypothetical protein
VKNWLLDIWEFDAWIIKFFLLLVFAFNLGLPQGCTRVAIEDFKKTGSVENRFQEELKLRQFIMRKVDLAEQKIAAGNHYSPYDYFQDLADYHAKRKELKVSDGFCPEIDRLMSISQLSINRGPFKERDIEIAREKYKSFIDPGRIPREEIQKDLKSLGWRGILFWLLWLYLKTMPLILILYFIWMRDERRAIGDYGSFRFPKPGKFLLLLVGYPFVFGYRVIRWWIVTSREAVAEAELRRSNRLFAYISEKDLEKIKRFAKSNLSFSQWRGQLRELGFKPRHSLASALLVTLMFMFFIRPLEAGTRQVKDHVTNLALEQIVSSQNLPRMSIVDAGKNHLEKSRWSWEKSGDDLAVDSWKAVILLPYFSLPFDIAYLFAKDFLREIFHVPLQAVRFEAKFAA